MHLYSPVPLLLVVQIYCETHQFESQDKNNEEITMNPVKVKKKVERFQRILERSIKYEPDKFKIDRE